MKFTIEDTPEMFEQYPYHFKLSILYTLKEKSIVTEYIVENLSDEVMPYFIGGHLVSIALFLRMKLMKIIIWNLKTRKLVQFQNNFLIQGF